MRKIGLSIMLVSAAIGVLKGADGKRITPLDRLNKAGVSSECLQEFEKVQSQCQLGKQEETKLDVWWRLLNDAQIRRSEILKRKKKREDEVEQE